VLGTQMERHVAKRLGIPVRGHLGPHPRAGRPRASLAADGVGGRERHLRQLDPSADDGARGAPAADVPRGLRVPRRRRRRRTWPRTSRGSRPRRPRRPRASGSPRGTAPTRSPRSRRTSRTRLPAAATTPAAVPSRPTRRRDGAATPRRSCARSRSSCAARHAGTPSATRPSAAW
jgi:hypothetical protein